ncbi:hypothetical protein Droror1_Dr00018199 [Drosera rotundifolia]
MIISSHLVLIISISLDGFDRVSKQSSERTPLAETLVRTRRPPLLSSRVTSQAPPATLAMAVHINSTMRLGAQGSSSRVGADILKSSCVSPPLLTLSPRGRIKQRRRQSHILVSSNDSITSGSSFKDGEGPLAPLETSLSTTSVEKKGSGGKTGTSVPKKAMPLTAREKLRAARVLSRYSESKAVKQEMGSEVLDAIREVDKGKGGLPEAPSNFFDDSKRGMPQKGWTFDFPGLYNIDRRQTRVS